MPLSPAHRKLLLAQALGSVAMNVPLNGALAWLTFPPIAAMPLWARGPCVAFDTFGTSFFLPLITCLILTPITRRLVRTGVVPPKPREELPALVRFWPENFVGRGALVGLLSAFTVGLPTLVALTLAGAQEMTRGEMAIYKAVYTMILGVIVTPLFGLRAVADRPA